MERSMTKRTKKLTTLACVATLVTGLAGSVMAQTAGATVDSSASVSVSASTDPVTTLLDDVTSLLGDLGLGGIL
jgi:hypothetical protein